MNNLNSTFSQDKQFNSKISVAQKEYRQGSETMQSSSGYVPYNQYGGIRSVQEVGVLLILFVSILMLGILFSIAEEFVHQDLQDSSASITQNSEKDYISFSFRD